MPRHVLLGFTLLLATSPALAARVTNLDSVPHVVTFERAGSVHEQVVEPNNTVFFDRADGVVSLKGAPAATDTLNSGGGLLNGVIGAPRGSRIPAGPGDDFTIWPGGKMHLQRRIKSFTGGN